MALDLEHVLLALSVTGLIAMAWNDRSRPTRARTPARAGRRGRAR